MKIESQGFDRNNNRRDFLQKAAFMMGGLGLWGLRFPSVFGQDPTETCRPPGDLSAPIPFTPASTRPLRTRKSIWDLNAPELAKLDDAYDKMRKLPEDDPRSWLSQARIHCYYCAGSFANPTTVDIHGGWFFFPWHRAYLYFHERILGSLIGDPSLALPYWDWDNPLRRTFPQPYAQGSLRDTVREATPTSTPSLEDWFKRLKTSIKERIEKSDAEDFLGTPPDFFNNHGGVIENGPHGLVHLWAGQTGIQSPAGVPDMGVLQTASRDPIFFAHHNNIDRLMEVWRYYPRPPVPHTLPGDGSWLDQRWSFYDIDPSAADPRKPYRWVSISVRDVLDTKNIGYVYANITPPVAVRESPGVIPPARRHATRKPYPTTKKIQIEPHIAPADGRKRYILHVDGIQIPSGQSAVVEVFVNKPDADLDSSTELENYFGYFVIVAKSLGGGHNHQPINITLDVTEKPIRLLTSRNAPTVTLVPLNQNPDDIRLPYDRAYVTVK